MWCPAIVIAAPVELLLSWMVIARVMTQVIRNAIHANADARRGADRLRHTCTSFCSRPSSRRLVWLGPGGWSVLPAWGEKFAMIAIMPAADKRSPRDEQRHRAARCQLSADSGVTGTHP